MNKKKSRILCKEKLTNKGLSLGGWDSAIAEAESQIQDATQRIATLKTAIGTFKHLQESGAPYPNVKKQSETTCPKIEESAQ